MSDTNNKVLIEKSKNGGSYAVSITEGSDDYHDSFLMARVEKHAECPELASVWSEVGYYMAEEILKLRESHDATLYDLNAAICRESIEREKNTRLLALIAELEEEKSQATFQPVAARDVLKERLRQINQEGWTPEHDDTYESGEIAGAAACYARHVNARGWVYKGNPSSYQLETEPNNWPWDPEWWKPVSPRRDLVRAGALILAEIDRIDRASYAESGGE